MSFTSYELMSWLASSSVTIGLASDDHVVPFQMRWNGAVWVTPTAWHRSGAQHEMPVRASYGWGKHISWQLSPASFTFGESGTVLSRHVVPSQDSPTSVLSSALLPTATHAVVVGHDIELRSGLVGRSSDDQE